MTKRISKKMHFSRIFFVYGWDVFFSANERQGYEISYRFEWVCIMWLLLFVHCKSELWKITKVHTASSQSVVLSHFPYLITYTARKYFKCTWLLSESRRHVIVGLCAFVIVVSYICIEAILSLLPYIFFLHFSHFPSTFRNPSVFPHSTLCWTHRIDNSQTNRSVVTRHENDAVKWRRISWEWTTSSQSSDHDVFIQFAIFSFVYYSFCS